ncbi:hypothetical protein CK203_001208 [Vitis vinifera]|uniref:Bifunctional inhibitor/plant lipid transfer protein/seed storage helical domain-containing protein n=1 Tax=Vitis vinifera TaxID=29760 RepID=A0A438KMF4_VITVI|nr:hypothetical protein CK203_001208 [Vitis vinifera]
MNSTSPAHSNAIISLLLLTMIALCSTAAQLPAGGCAGELIAFSPCLPFVSSPPNNVTSSASSQCCGVFSSAFESADGACLCYLIQQPLILGFPLNATKLLALSSLCPPGNATSARNASLESFCIGSPALPPLQGTTGPGLGLQPPTTSDSAPAKSPPHFPSFPAEPPGHLPTLPSSPPNSSVQPEKMDIIRIWFQQGIIVVIVLIQAYL